MNSNEYLISFESTHYAIMIEKKLKELYKVNMIPTPREITASCGLSIKFSNEDLNGVESILSGFDKEMFDVYKIKTANTIKEFIKIDR